MGRMLARFVVLWLVGWCGGCQQWQSLVSAPPSMSLPPIEVLTLEGFPIDVPNEGQPLTIDSVLIRSDPYALSTNVTAVAAAAQDPAWTAEKTDKLLASQPDCVVILDGQKVDVIVLDLLALTSFGKQGVPLKGSVDWKKFNDLNLADLAGSSQPTNSLTVLMNDTGDAVKYVGDTDTLPNYSGVIGQLTAPELEEPRLRDFVRRGDVLIIRRIQAGRLLSIFLPMPPPNKSSTIRFEEKLNWINRFEIAPLPGDILEVAWSDDLVRRNPPSQAMPAPVCQHHEGKRHSLFRHR
jgi:hypothetical protein